MNDRIVFGHLVMVLIVRIVLHKYRSRSSKSNEIIFNKYGWLKSCDCLKYYINKSEAFTSPSKSNSLLNTFYQLEMALPIIDRNIFRAEFRNFILDLRSEEVVVAGIIYSIVLFDT